MCFSGPLRKSDGDSGLGRAELDAIEPKNSSILLQ